MDEQTLESMFRRVLREELSRSDQTPLAKSMPAKKVSAAVRAEMARRNKTTADLADALGMTKQTALARLKATYPFRLGELNRVAEMLGIATYDIYASAAMADRADSGVRDEALETAVMQPDPWPQPTRSGQGRGRKRLG